MARFINDTDYDYKIRSEIKALLDNSDSKIKLNAAEDVAIAMIKSRLSGRYDTNTIFTAAPDNGDDLRNKFIVDLVITIALYKLYGQVGTTDIPAHRQHEYDDAITWLRDAGKGDINVSDLPSDLSDDNPGDFRMSSRLPNNHKS